MNTLDEPIINVRGERVALGPLHRTMIPLQTAWINDFPTTRTLGPDALPRTLDEHEHWYERVTSARITFAVYDLTDMAAVGNVNIMHIDERHRTCELGIAIMAPERRGKGLGTEATRLVTDYAIRDLGMHNVHLATLAFNAAGARAYEKAGFREYGRRREAWRHNGRWWDIIYMDVVAGEWESPVMRQMMEPDAPR